MIERRMFELQAPQCYIQLENNIIKLLPSESFAVTNSLSTCGNRSRSGEEERLELLSSHDWLSLAQHSGDDGKLPSP